MSQSLVLFESADFARVAYLWLLVIYKLYVGLQCVHLFGERNFNRLSCKGSSAWPFEKLRY